MSKENKGLELKRFKINAINEIIEKMNSSMVKDKTSNSSIKSVTRRYTNSDIFNNGRSVKDVKTVEAKSKRRHTNSKIFDDQSTKIGSKKVISTSKMKNINKESTYKVDDLLNKKRQGKEINMWNSFDLEIENINSTINKLNGELKEIGIKKRNVVNDLKTVIDSESNNLDIKKRELVLKSWDTLEKEEKSINKRIIDLKKELKNIYQNKTEIIDELKKSVDLKIAELDLEIIGSKKKKLKKVMKKRISKRALVIKKDLRDNGLL